MDSKTAQKLNDRTRTAAFKIVKAMSTFDSEAPEVRHQAEQIIMARVQRIRRGSNEVIDGDDLIRVVEESPPEPDTP